ncbi:MAG TPA: precorrin-4 C(11)-methyltransferase [Planctomycetaceae bacterium]|nr:precorrin-4 C(11)-methyltransferase [Planctomycetaceae bacterium]
MIHFVGAGPGDKELLTLKGARLLSQADCIIHAGSLVNPELLDFAKEGCRVYDSASMTLEEVVAVMRECAVRNQTVVRLHTGDPGLYGAIREQIDLLIQYDISYEVVPGVSSFSAAAATLGVEYTLPGVSQTLILTRMAGRTPVPPKENIVELAKIQASMAVFLSADKLTELSARLIEGGYADDTPAAIIFKASWPDEIVAKTTLANLAAEGKRIGVTKTALILIGRFLGDSYDRSMLYHPDFTHGYRTGGERHA